ncbi:ATP synthase subunit I [Hoeflea sp.]|uniref:N-ATPase subunit AtpR n=1 Tax=Hoeflea sp. TaxID=1940281 RepID=UPI002AFF5088|nr:ATP synthase subunit I [Hoeflea sp.]
MIAIDWTSFALGAGAGSLMGVLFFAGLALGIQLALRTERAALVLALSAALRIAALLVAGWLIAGAGVTALAGFGSAFMLVRLIAISIMRISPPAEAC